MKLYLSPSLGRSCDLPEKFHAFLESEETFYTETIYGRQLEYANPQILADLENGLDKYKKTVDTVYGEDDLYTFDRPGLRFFVTLDSLEDLDDFVMLLDAPLTLLRRDPADKFQQEFLECVYGSPLVPDSMVAEVDVGFEGIFNDESDNWKTQS